MELASVFEIVILSVRSGTDFLVIYSPRYVSILVNKRNGDEGAPSGGECRVGREEGEGTRQDEEKAGWRGMDCRMAATNHKRTVLRA